MARHTVHLSVVPEPSRRQAMQWVLGAVAASMLPGGFAAGASQAIEPGSSGYGVDPDMIVPNKPGKYWPLLMTEAQKKTAQILADVIIPRDTFGPAASEVGVVAMLNEWVSAPYPQQQQDRPVILEGLEWIEAESTRRFDLPFSAITLDQRQAICDDICYSPRVSAAYKTAARFFSRFRTLCASAYYATPAGWQAIGYVGNIPLQQFDGPPPEVLAKLDVTQTVR